jgi:hypothetical protein
VAVAELVRWARDLGTHIERDGLIALSPTDLVPRLTRRTGQRP